MKLPMLTYLVHLIEEIFKTDGPVVAKVAAGAAVEAAESDPKVQAITAASAALLDAASTLKAAMADHPDAPVVTPAPAAASETHAS